MMTMIGRYGVLSTEQIAKIFFPKTALTTVRRRLRILENADRIYRVHGLDSGGVAWALTKNTAQKIGCMYPVRHFNRNSLIHDVALSEVRYVLESTSLCSNWVPEHVLKTQSNMNQMCLKDEKPFVPDAIFSMRQKDKTCVIALELELSGKNYKRYETILTRYKKKKTLWAVWYLVANEQLGKMLEKVWREINDGRRNDLLIWSILPSFLHEPLHAHVRNEYFSYPLKQLFSANAQGKRTALSGALPESMRTNKFSENTTEPVS